MGTVFNFSVLNVWPMAHQSRRCLCWTAKLAMYRLVQRPPIWQRSSRCAMYSTHRWCAHAHDLAVISRGCTQCFLGNHNDCERSSPNHHLLMLTTIWKGTDGLRRPNTAKELLSGRRILWKVHCHFWGCPHPNASIRQWDLLWLTMFSRVEKSEHLSRLIRENKIHRSSWKIKRETYRI